METLSSRKLSQILYYRFFSLYQASTFLEDNDISSFAISMMNQIRPWIKSGLLFSASLKDLEKMNLTTSLISAIQEIKITKDIAYINIYQKKLPVWIQELIKPEYLDIKELRTLIHENEISCKEDLLQFIQKDNISSPNKDLIERILTYSKPENFPYMFSKVYTESDPIISSYQGEKIKGIIHNHTTYSDGQLSILSLINESKKYGYEYVGISDHSTSTMLGLEERELSKQLDEIKLQRKNNPKFTILFGIECEILPNGDLDFSNTLLSQFDYVIVGIHSNYGMSKEKATERVINAISNPYCDILAHPGGRILGSKPGLLIDTKKIIDCCIQNSVVIEINGNHKRLDLDPKYISYAVDKGAYFEFASDVHKINDFKKINNCISISDKYDIPKDRIINLYDAYKLRFFFKTLHNKKRNKP